MRFLAPLIAAIAMLAMSQLTRDQDHEQPNRPRLFMTLALIAFAILLMSLLGLYVALSL